AMINSSVENICPTVCFSAIDDQKHTVGFSYLKSCTSPIIHIVEQSCKDSSRWESISVGRDIGKNAMTNY
ncbi:hypothetical protein NDI37_12070, partial [Funiculus sociatus GB2-A5]